MVCIYYNVSTQLWFGKHKYGFEWLRPLCIYAYTLQVLLELAFKDKDYRVK